MKLRGCDCECLDGWDKIILRLEHTLSPDVEVLQVKEKYGTLRVYLGAATDDDFDLVDVAEVESTKTCEVCGSKENARGSCAYGWVVTRCSLCRGGPYDSTDAL